MLVVQILDPKIKRKKKNFKVPNQCWDQSIFRRGLTGEVCVYGRAKNKLQLDVSEIRLPEIPSKRSLSTHWVRKTGTPRKTEK